MAIQSKLDETCNLVTTSTKFDSYVFAVKPVDLTPNCTHHVTYFEYNPQTKNWKKLLEDTISTMPYIVQVGLSKDVTYRVQHYIVSNENSYNHSEIFEAEFRLKKTVKSIDSVEEALVMLSQSNIDVISGSTTENIGIRSLKNY